LTAALLIEGETESKGDTERRAKERESSHYFAFIIFVLARSNLFIRYLSAILAAADAGNAKTASPLLARYRVGFIGKKRTRQKNRSPEERKGIS